MHSTAVLPSYHSTDSSPSLEIKLLKLDLASQGIYTPNQSTSESFMGTRFGENYTFLDLNGLKTANLKADHAIISSEIMTGSSPHHIKDLVSSAKLSEPTPTSKINTTPLYKTTGGSNLGTPRDYNFSNPSFGGGAGGSKDDLLLKNYNLHSSQDFLGETAKADLDSLKIAQIVKENLPSPVKNLRNSVLETDLNKTSGSNIAEEVKRMLEKDKSPALAKQSTELTTSLMTVAQIVKENLPSNETENHKKSSSPPGGYLETKKMDSTGSSSNIAEEVKKMLEQDKKEKLSVLTKQSEVQSTESSLIAQIVKENLRRSMTADYLDSVDLKEKIASNKSAEDIHNSLTNDFVIAQIVKENLGGSYLETQKIDSTGSSSNIAEEVKKMLEKDKFAKQTDAVQLKPSADLTNSLSIAQIVKENLPSNATGGSYLETQNTGSSSNIAEEVKKMLEKDKLYNLEKQSEVDLIAQIVKENFKRSLTAGYLEIQKTDDSVDLKEKIASNKSAEDIHNSLTNDFVIAQIVKENLKNNVKIDDITIPSIKSTENILPLRRKSDDKSLLIAQIVKENLKSSPGGESYLDVQKTDESEVDLKEKTSSSKSSDVIFDVQKTTEEPIHPDNSLMIAKIVKENLPSISVCQNKINEEVKEILEKEESPQVQSLKSDDDTHELMIAQIVKENLPSTSGENLKDQARDEILEKEINENESENKKASFDPREIKNILNLDIKDLSKYLNTGETPKASPDLSNKVPNLETLGKLDKEMLPQRNNSAGLDIQDILNEFNPKNIVVKKELIHEELPEEEGDQPEPTNVEDLLGNFKSTENVRASISLNFEFEYNLEKQNEILISDFINNLQADDEHPSYNELLLLVQNYANARVFRGSEQTLFLALSFAFFEKLIFKDQNLLMRMTPDYPSLKNIFDSGINEYADPSYDQLLKRLKAYLQLDNEARDAVSFFESIVNSTKDYQNSLLLFKDILFQVFASSEDYFAFISNCMTQQSFKWITSPSFEDHQTLFDLFTKILKTSIRMIIFTTESLQENIYISPNESFITIFYDQRSATSYILTKKEEIQPVSEERGGIIEDGNVSDRDTQIEVSELSMSDYQEIEEEQILQNRPARLESLEILKIREVTRVVVEETPIETEFAPMIEDDPQVEISDDSIEEQLSNQGELITIENHSSPMIASEEIMQNEKEVLPPSVHIEIKEIDLLPKSDGEEEVKDELVAARSKVRDEINAILRSLSLNNSPVFFAPIDSFSKEVDCSPSHALRSIPNYLKKPLLQTTDELEVRDQEFMEISNQYLNLVVVKSGTTKTKKPEALINLYKKILAKKEEKSQESQELQE